MYNSGGPFCAAKLRGSPSSLLLLALALLLLSLLLDTSNLSWDAKSIIFFEVVVLVHVPFDQQVWHCLFQLIQEAVVDDWDLVDVDED